MKDKRFRKPEIKAIAAVVPPNTLYLNDLKKEYSEKEIDRIIESTGIKAVAYNDPELTTSDYSILVAEELFRQYKIEKEQIDGLVYISETSDYIAPNTASIMQARLGLPNNCITFEIRSGCAGYVYGLFQAFMLIECGYCTNVLLCVGSGMSKYINREDRSLKMVMGDSASATLVSAGEGLSAFSFYSDGSGANHLIIPAGGSRMPVKRGITDRIEYDADGNGKTLENLHMDGMDIMVFVTRNIPSVISQTIGLAGWCLDEVELFAMHQANKMMLERLAKILKINKEKMPLGISCEGNSGADSIPVMLCNMFADDNHNLKKTVMCGFGSGLSASCAALDLSKARIMPTIKIKR